MANDITSAINELIIAVENLRQQVASNTENISNIYDYLKSYKDDIAKIHLLNNNSESLEDHEDRIDDNKDAINSIKAQIGEKDSAKFQIISQTNTTQAKITGDSISLATSKTDGSSYIDITENEIRTNRDFHVSENKGQLGLITYEKSGTNKTIALDGNTTINGNLKIDSLQNSKEQYLLGGNYINVATNNDDNVLKYKIENGRIYIQGSISSATNTYIYGNNNITSINILNVANKPDDLSNYKNEDDRKKAIADYIEDAINNYKKDFIVLTEYNKTAISGYAIMSCTLKIVTDVTDVTNVTDNTKLTLQLKVNSIKNASGTICKIQSSPKIDVNFDFPFTVSSQTTGTSST